MSRIREIISNEQRQYVIYLVLSLGIVGFTGILYLSNPLSFQSYIGNINPLLVIPLLILLGFLLLTYLLSNGWFEIYKRENLRGLLLFSILATLLAFVMILIDLNFIFPEDLNVLYPQSLLFYPTMGFVVEILFHIVPLSLFLFLLTLLFKDVNLEKIIWCCILIVSLLEPLYQISLGFSREYPLWIVVYVGLHLFLFNILQLYNFKRYDFLSMYSFRLVYYIIWHIV
jgi:membrane-associated HD superfamily phosphohydrolase